MTAPATTSATTPATTSAAPGPRLVDAPTDYRPRVRGRRGATHRFPAATCLGRRVAIEERAIARQALDVADRSASRRIGGVGVLVALLLVAVLVLLATGRAEAGSGTVTLVTLGGLLVVAVAGIVVSLRSHEREHDALAERVRMYDARLAQLGSRP